MDNQSLVFLHTRTDISWALRRVKDQLPAYDVRTIQNPLNYSSKRFLDFRRTPFASEEEYRSRLQKHLTKSKFIRSNKDAALVLENAQYLDLFLEAEFSGPAFMYDENLRQEQPVTLLTDIYDLKNYI